MDTIIDNIKVMLLLLDAEENDDLLITTQFEQREKVDALFLIRKTEGYF